MANIVGSTLQCLSIEMSKRRAKEGRIKKPDFAGCKSSDRVFPGGLLNHLQIANDGGSLQWEGL